MADAKEGRRRSMVGAPPSKSTPQHGERRRGRPAAVIAPPVEEPEDNEDLSESSDADSNVVGASPRPNASPERKRRKKRRLRFTDYGLKAKKRAERRDRTIEKKEVVEITENTVSEETEESPLERPKYAEYTPFQLLCDCLIRKLILKDPEEFFRSPVSASMAPDYYSVIETPMDFFTMRKKVDANEYKQLEDLRNDLKLIVENAMSYNKPNTVYYLAAQKLQFIAKYYFSETYLEYLRYHLPFGNEIPYEQTGLKPKIATRNVYQPAAAQKDSKIGALRNAIADNTDAKFILRHTNAQRRALLAEKKPNWHLGYIDNKPEGPATLNILTGEEKGPITIGDLVGRLEKGNPCLPSSYEPLKTFENPVSYTNYGPFCSFAPQFDSTWAALNKRDSDLLLACYGDKQNAIDALSLRQMTSDAGFTSTIDRILDMVTDGEHSRTIDALDRGDKPATTSGGSEEEAASEKTEAEGQQSKDAHLKTLLADVESLANLGFDMAFLSDAKRALGVEVESGGDAETRLATNAQMLADLGTLQQRRLGAAVPLNLGDARAAGDGETQLAGKLSRSLAADLNEFGVKPAMLSTPAAIHQAIGLNDDDCDYELLNEFLDLDS